MSRITHDLCDALAVPHRHPGRRRREEAPFNENVKGAQPLVASVGEVVCFDPLPLRANTPVPNQSPLTSAAISRQRRLILAGGSGFLGGLLARYFIARGWNVVVLTRAKVGQRFQPVRATGKEAASAVGPDCRSAARQYFGDRLEALSHVEWDGRTLGDWVTSLDGADAVINLAGRSVNCRYHERNRRLMMDSRVEATRVIGEAIARCTQPPRVWLNFSTATIYKHTYGPAWNETGEIGATPEARDAFSIEVATAWERAFNEAITPRTRKVALRSAMVFGLNADANNVYRVLRRLVRCGLGGRMGSGRQFVSWIHETDFCRAVEYLIEHKELSGPVNLAAPNPLTNAEMMRMLRRVLGMPMGLPATEWMLELGAFFLRTETELIIKSRRVVPGRLLEAGFKFEFEHLESALRDLERRLRAG